MLPAEFPPGLSTSALPLPLLRRGKVRDVYEAPEGVLLVATDRLSAFDVVFEDPIPGKGIILNQLSGFWFRKIQSVMPSHFITDAPAIVANDPLLSRRCTLARRTKPLAVECVVRGYLEGSAWKDYLATGEVSGVLLPAGMRKRERFPQPIFTPSTKAEAGHDEPIGFDQVVAIVGSDVAEQIRARSLQLFQIAHDFLHPRGIVISDTKFEFGIDDHGQLLLIDEILTPDSSRYWPAEQYTPDHPSPTSFDKQFVRDYVEGLGWNKQPPAPRLPDEVIRGTTQRYVDIFHRITA